MGMNSRRPSSFTVADMLKAGHVYRVLLCKNPGLACRSVTVVDMRTMPSHEKALPADFITWGCSHCGHPLTLDTSMEDRYSQYKPMTWDELQQARRDAWEAAVPSRPVQAG